MLELTPPLAVVAAALAVGGAFKLWQPGPTAATFAALGLPGRPALARASGAAELVLGLAAALVGGPALAALVALAYAVFAVVALRLLALGSAAASCGCFGRLSAPTTGLHVAVDVVAAAVALAAALTGAPGLVTAVGETPLAGTPLLGLVALGTWALVAALTALPEALVAARRGPARPAVDEFHLVGRG